MPNEDWRFKNFKDPSGGAYNRTLAVNTPFARDNFIANAPKPPQQVTGTARIANPSNTDWNATFGQNAPQSPSGTNWGKEFGSVWAKNGGSTLGTGTGPGGASAAPFSFTLSPQVDQSQLKLGTDVSSFYKDRVANMDITPRDHSLYGAGEDYGFNH